LEFAKELEEGDGILRRCT